MLSATSQRILEEGAAKFGLMDKLPILVRYASEAILIETKVAQAALLPGQSRLAGRPDLPPSFAWPKDLDNADMLFVAQINLAELPKSGPKSVLPMQGHLYFFCTPRAEGQVVYHPGDDLASAQQTFGPPPVTGGFWKRVFSPRLEGLRLCEVMFRIIPSLPPWNHPEYGELETELGISPKNNALADLNDFFGSSDSAKLLGFAD